MKALVYEGEKDLQYQDRADPRPASGEVLVDIDAVGICGSDMHAFLGHDARRPAPLILGHEAAGAICALGDNVDGQFHLGDRVTINPLVTQGQSDACQEGRENICPDRQIMSMPPREGAFAQKAVVPTENLVKIPDHITFERAALAEPIACGWHAVRLASERLVPEKQDCKALAIGGGAIGVGTALSLKANGFDDITIIEANDKRRNYLRQKTEFAIFAPDEIADSDFFHVIIDGVGIEPTRALSSEKAMPGGVIAHIGLGSASGGLDIRRMTLQEITFIGCYTYTKNDFRDTAQAIFDGRLGDLSWIETRDLSAGQKAFEDILAGNVEAPKIILKP